MNGCETMKCEFWDGEICTYPPQVCRYREQEDDIPPSVPVSELEDLVHDWEDMKQTRPYNLNYFRDGTLSKLKATIAEVESKS